LGFVSFVLFVELDSSLTLINVLRRRPRAAVVRDTIAGAAVLERGAAARSKGWVRHVR
jgi:hypothetical protein